MQRIAITGVSGRMGRELIHEIAQNEQNICLSAAIARPSSALIGRDAGLCVGLDELGVRVSNAVSQANFDVLIDFTLPESALIALADCVNLKKPMVIGTTGFSDVQLQEIHAAASHIPIVKAANMSVGVNLSLRLLEQAAAVIGDQSDIEIVETHHRNKLDAPSGTALRMGEVVAATLGRDLGDSAVTNRQSSSQPRSRDVIGFSSIRAGDVVGEHTVIFATDGERIEITHKASDRRIYAAGALRAATWVATKPPGLYDMQDVLDFSS